MRTITSMSLHGNKQIIRRGLVQGLKSRPNKQQGISRELRLSIKDSFHQNNILTAGRERVYMVDQSKWARHVGLAPAKQTKRLPAALRQRVLSPFNHFFCDLLAKRNRIERLVLGQPAQDR
jgi:hypothetical protein